MNKLVVAVLVVPIPLVLIVGYMSYVGASATREAVGVCKAYSATKYGTIEEPRLVSFTDTYVICYIVPCRFDEPFEYGGIKHIGKICGREEVVAIAR